MTAAPGLAVKAQVRLLHATHAGGHFLAAGTRGEVVSLHRLHARVAVRLGDQRLVLRLPLEALARTT